MAISHDDKHLITCARSGGICIWRLVNTEGKAIKVDKDFTYTPEILISKTDLRHKLNQINELKVRILELQTEHEYQMRQNDVVHKLKLKDVHEGYFNAIEELKEKNEVICASFIDRF